jgi:Fe-S cluster assembly protein SufD
VSSERGALASFQAAAAQPAQGAETPQWLVERRLAGWRSFEAAGLPTTRDEDWRFTSVAPIARSTFVSPNGDVDPAALGERATWLRFGAPCALVFVNGCYAPALSCPWPDDSVRLAPLSHFLLESPGLIEPHLARVANGGGGAFAALNTALGREGAVVVVAPGRVIETPISLVFIESSGSAPQVVAVHPRVLVVVGRGARATLVEAYGGTPGCYLANAVTEVVVEDGGDLDHLRIQKEDENAFHMGALGAHLGRDSRYRLMALDLGASLSRNNIDVRLGGEGGECELDGLFMLAGSQHADSHTTIEHASPHTTSREVYRGIVEGVSHGVFHGRIIVRAGAQKTDAFQLNKNLILSRGALIHSTPQLQIHADDVRCKHASTTGQIDPAALFYLRARGIGEDAARQLLTYAFAGDIISRMRVPAVRQAIEALLLARLPGALEVQP